MREIPFDGKIPRVQSSFIAPDCYVIGNVVLKEGSSVWFGSIIRGDVAVCEIGKGTVVLEHCYVENSIIGDSCMLSHGVIAHKCTIGNNVLVGIGARIITGSEIGDNCLIGAGAFILPNTKIPPNSVVIEKGTVVRSIQERDIRYIQDSVREVHEKAKILTKTLSGTNYSAGS